jgi:hypothetical protein
MTGSVSKSLAINAVITALLASAAFAGSHNWTIKDGQGEQLSVKKGWFGSKNIQIEDRLGNKVVKKKGLLGGKETQVDLLGNHYKQKKGLFGGNRIEGSSILGDSISTKKSLLGNRQTTVDVSGVSNAIRTLFKGDTIAPLKDPAQMPLNSTPELIDQESAAAAGN